MEPCIAVSAAQAVQKVVSIADVDDPRRITTSLLFAGSGTEASSPCAE